jgi:putative DNA primase/helicase
MRKPRRPHDNVVLLPGAHSQVPLPSPAAGSTGTDADRLELVRFSEDALAAQFADEYHSDFRYVDQWGKWMFYDGTVWRPDVTRIALSRARAICRENASKVNADTGRKSLTTRKTVAAVEGMARSDRRLVEIAEHWDADLWAINTVAGLVDLRTGKIHDHDPAHLCTKVTSVAPDPKRQTPLWLGFLDRVTGGDKALQGFLQRMAGYCLTGDTSEHALFFPYGTGANGKGTFTNAMSGIMADYHRTAPMEMFLASSTDRHPTDKAGLRGARLVTANETQEGRRWDEAKIKDLTGGDMITARFMRQDFFDFRPQFKFVISGNHKPSLRSVDEAIRRRFLLIPFTVTIPAEERDPELGDKLKDEWPGILQWAIDGCQQWQQIGLAPPPVVMQATQEYLHAEDAVLAWIEERGTRDVNAWTAFAVLWQSWQDWTQQSGEYTGGSKQFQEAIQRHGLVRRRSHDGSQRAYCGLRLK